MSGPWFKVPDVAPWVLRARLPVGEVPHRAVSINDSQAAELLGPSAGVSGTTVRHQCRPNQRYLSIAPSLSLSLSLTHSRKLSPFLPSAPLAAPLQLPTRSPTLSPLQLPTRSPRAIFFLSHVLSLSLSPTSSIPSPLSPSPSPLSFLAPLPVTFSILCGLSLSLYNN